MITVYGLTDPYGQIRYVGQTCRPSGRFRDHDGLFDGLTGFAVLATVTNEESARTIENQWIAFFGRDNLFNERGGSATETQRPIEEARWRYPERFSNLFDSKACDECGTIFTPTRHWQVFCTLECRRHWYKEVRRRFVAMQADVGLLKGKK